MSPIPPTAAATSPFALLPVAFELKAVSGITDAVTNNLLAAGGVPGPLGTVIMPKGNGGRFGPAAVNSISPEPRIEPRHVHQPEPRIEGRWVHRPEPRVEPRDRVEVGVEPRKVGGLAKVWEMPVERPVEVQEKPRLVDNPRELAAGHLLDTFA